MTDQSLNGLFMSEMQSDGIDSWRSTFPQVLYAQWRDLSTPHGRKPLNEVSTSLKSGGGGSAGKL
jgi:hypothetical protein